jgi:hypothetical protein
MLRPGSGHSPKNKLGLRGTFSSFLPKYTSETPIDRRPGTFQADGRHYVILTGAPVTRGDKVWVLLEPGLKFPGQPQSWFITSGELKQIAPEAVVSSEAAPRN